jgi:hypothetical protein
MLWALAALHVHARNPEVFGEVEDPNTWKAQYETLKARRDDLFTRIGQEFLPGDTVVGQPGANGMALITFKIAEGKVPTYPLQNAGMRLVNHLLESDPSWATPQALAEPRPRRQKVAAG